MPTPTPLSGKRVLVMGLGRFGGGIGVSKWLVSQGAIVTVNDSAQAEDLTDSLKALEGLPISFSLGGHPTDIFTHTDLIVVNPAVDRDKSQPLQAAIAAGIPLTSEINLFLERCPATTIGITGSVGKSTTTTLIYEALKAALTPTQIKNQKSKIENPLPQVFLGGNIGKSLLSELPNIRPQDLVVLELSSFMLESTPDLHWSPNLALVTNIFPNHLDRHGGTMAGYTAAKQNILRFQTPADLALLNADHDLVNRWAHLTKAQVIKFTTRGPADKIPPLQIPGEHNRSNAAAALAVLDALAARGIPLNRSAAVAALSSFTGLSHRLQFVHAYKTPSGREIRCFNDSKATTPEASITAIHAFPPKTALFFIGGYDKHADMSLFTQLLADNAAAVIGLGATGPALISQIQTLNPALRAHFADTLEAAVPLAKQWAADPASSIAALVLSPASASWGQFANYEFRGARFTSLCQQVTEK